MKTYQVCINGKNVPTESARVSAVPFNQVWPGYQRPLAQTELSYFVNYCASLPASVEIIVEGGGDDDAYLLRPLSAGVKPVESGGVWRFEVSFYGSLVFECNSHEVLHLFFSAPAVLENATYCFTEGEYEVGRLELASGESVYIGERAVVYGSVYARGASDIRLYGRGVLDGSREERSSMRCYEEDTIGTVKLYECHGVAIEGIVLRDSAIWALNLFACSCVTVDGVKLVGHWRYNTDGVDIVNCRDITVKNSFIRAFDDGITLKGIDAYQNHDMRDILVENCVLWCGWGRTLELGLETACSRFTGIRFCNCDLIHNSAVCLDIQNGDWATVQNVVFENIRVEYSHTSREVIQRERGEVYPDLPENAPPALISVSNPKYNLTNDPMLNAARSEYGRVRNVLFCNITAVGCGEMPLIEFVNSGPGGEIKDITLENVTVNGRPVKAADIRTGLPDGAIIIKSGQR